MAAVQRGLVMHRGLGFALDIALGLWNTLYEVQQRGGHNMKT